MPIGHPFSWRIGMGLNFKETSEKLYPINNQQIFVDENFNCVHLSSFSKPTTQNYAALIKLILVIFLKKNSALEAFSTKACHFWLSPLKC